MAEITLVSTDGKKIKTKFDAVKVCKPVEEFYKDNGMDVEIPVSQPASVLEKIVKYCEQFHNKSGPQIDKPIKHTKLSDIIKDEWLLKFLEMPLNEIYDLITACDYLALKSLEDYAACAVAVRIVGKSVEDIRKEFGIVNDYVPAEEAEIKEFFSWTEELWQ